MVSSVYLYLEHYQIVYWCSFKNRVSDFTLHTNHFPEFSYQTVLECATQKSKPIRDPMREHKGSSGFWRNFIFRHKIWEMYMQIYFGKIYFLIYFPSTLFTKSYFETPKFLICPSTTCTAFMARLSSQFSINYSSSRRFKLEKKLSNKFS